MEELVAKRDLGVDVGLRGLTDVAPAPRDLTHTFDQR